MPTRAFQTYYELGNHSKNQWLKPLRNSLSVSRTKFDVRDFWTITGLDMVYNFKYLRVLLDHTLSWEDHGEYIGNKTSTRLGILRQARKVLPKSTCVMLYNTIIVLPLFVYCSSGTVVELGANLI